RPRAGGTRPCRRRSGAWRHAGPALGAACQELVRQAVGPAAMTGAVVEPPLLGAAGGAGAHLREDGAAARAAAQRGGGAAALAGAPAGDAAHAGAVETKPIEPDQRTGPGDAFRAFDRTSCRG
ncbi:hypothetical protein ACLEQD_33070, partial [Corallococcus sp. 4LFB]